MNIVFLGLSITSSWGNGHASTYRALIAGLAARGHRVHFLERDAPWYAANRDLPRPRYCRVSLYRSVEELEAQHADRIRNADLVVVGSYVPEGALVVDVVLRLARGCTAFYDIDTPVTLAGLRRGSVTYLDASQIPAFDLYLSFTGGATLDRLVDEFGAQRAQAFYCAVDPAAHRPNASEPRDVDLGYLGTYSDDRQPTLERLLLEPARRWTEGRFVVAGAQYPATFAPTPNVRHITHLAPSEHSRFYGRSRFTLNVTRRDMIAAGFSPSVRLFEAAACGTAIISDWWPGIECFFTPGEEILIADDAEQVLDWLRNMTDEDRAGIGVAARHRVLSTHTSAHRAQELEWAVAGVSDPAERVTSAHASVARWP